MITLSKCKCCSASVSSEAQTCPQCGQPFPAISVDSLILNEIKNGAMLNAVKRYMDKYGCTLVEAKLMCERIQRTMI
jgi:hypothetical protein